MNSKEAQETGTSRGEPTLRQDNHFHPSASIRGCRPSDCGLAKDRKGDCGRGGGKGHQQQVQHIPRTPAQRVEAHGTHYIPEH